MVTIFVDHGNHLKWWLPRLPGVQVLCQCWTHGKIQVAWLKPNFTSFPGGELQSCYMFVTWQSIQAISNNHSKRGKRRNDSYLPFSVNSDDYLRQQAADPEKSFLPAAWNILFHATASYLASQSLSFASVHSEPRFLGQSGWPEQLCTEIGCKTLWHRTEIFAPLREGFFHNAVVWALETADLRTQTYVCLHKSKAHYLLLDWSCRGPTAVDLAIPGSKYS